MKLSERQKKSLGWYFGDLARIMIFIIFIGNAVADIHVSKTVIAVVLAIIFTVLGFVVLGSLKDDDSHQK